MECYFGEVMPAGNSFTARCNPEDIPWLFGVPFHGPGTYLDDQWQIIRIRRDVQDRTKTSPRMTLFCERIGGYAAEIGVPKMHDIRRHPFCEDTGWYRQIRGDRIGRLIAKAE